MLLLQLGDFTDEGAVERHARPRSRRHRHQAAFRFERLLDQVAFPVAARAARVAGQPEIGKGGELDIVRAPDAAVPTRKPGQPRPIHEKRDSASRIAYLAEPGVVGRIEECDTRWCKFQVGKRVGWIAQREIYGIGQSEQID